MEVEKGDQSYETLQTEADAEPLGMEDHDAMPRRMRRMFTVFLHA